MTPLPGDAEIIKVEKVNVREGDRYSISFERAGWNSTIGTRVVPTSIIVWMRTNVESWPTPGQMTTEDYQTRYLLVLYPRIVMPFSPRWFRNGEWDMSVRLMEAALRATLLRATLPPVSPE